MAGFWKERLWQNRILKMNYKNIAEISNNDIGKEIYVLAQVKKIRETSGPTIFELRDNTGIINATAFKRGERAFPNIVLGGNIQAKVRVKSRNDKLELEILRYDKINEQIVKTVDLKERSFLIKSDNLEKLRSIIINAAEIIKQAINESRPIVIRHHDDIDGYSSGIVLAKAIQPLIKEERSYLYLTRSSSRTPYYDYIDALRDLNTYLITKNRFDGKSPLIILCDLGSNSQSLKSINRLRMYDIDFVIVDHHRYDEENKNVAKVFLNPLAYGLDSNFNAGILASELALFINPVLKEIKHLPGLSAIADRSSGEDVNRYIKLSGFNEDYLMRWSIAIDHELFHLRFAESSGMLHDLFFPGKNNTKIINSLYPLIEKEFDKVKIAAKKYAKIIDFKNFKVVRIDKPQVAMFGDYASSKLIRITHDLFTGSRITLCEFNDSISFRADNVNKFSVVDLLATLRKKFSYSLLNGGGHDFAGNIRFNAASKEEIIKEIMQYLKKIDSK